MNPAAPAAARLGILLVVSGPSGSGKTTMARKLRDAGECSFAVSATTRPPRPGEKDGADYHFVSAERFAEMVQEGAFLEHATVHRNCYGSPAGEILAWLASGRDVLMDIDVQGAQQVRACADPLIRQCMVSVFVAPPTRAELETRLRSRGTESPEVFAVRTAAACAEISEWREYDYLILSRTPDEDYAALLETLRSERRASRRWLDSGWTDSYRVAS